MKLFKTKVEIKKPYKYIFPSFIVIILFVGYGLLMAGVESFSSSLSPFYYYQTLWSKKGFTASLFISLKVALLSTVLSIFIGIILTRTMFRLFSNDSWKLLAWFPMLIPHFVAAYIVFILFTPSGWFSSFLYEIGILNTMKDFPLIVNDPHYIGVILSYIWKEVPFVILMLLPIYQEIDFRYEDVVRTLGGGQWSIWKTVEFPWIWPVALEIGLILFAFTMSAYEIPALLGVTYPKTLPVLAYEWFYEGNWANRPLAQALMVCLSVLTVVSSILLLGVTKRWRVTEKVGERKC